MLSTLPEKTLLSWPPEWRGGEGGASYSSSTLSKSSWRLAGDKRGAAYSTDGEEGTSYEDLFDAGEEEEVVLAVADGEWVASVDALASVDVWDDGVGGGEDGGDRGEGVAEDTVLLVTVTAPKSVSIADLKGTVADVRYASWMQAELMAQCGMDIVDASR
jgi:hypothetical protein